MEKNITFTADGLILEGLLNHMAESDNGVVIAHPHPLYGGDMHNPVVEAIADAFAQKNHTTLKLNFRGVGKSQGDYDNGVGEQNDILGAVAYLEGLGISQIDLSGYSFGAWAISQLTDFPESVNHIYLVSPPIAMMPFTPTPALKKIKGIITGNHDDIAPPGDIKKLLQETKSTATLEIISGTDHFYGGHFHTIKSLLLHLIQ